ncbi:hypothetical protein KAR91_36875 [Candidatus Pacearchaeota archaeon]|nr:hypothetical protein [Candidatus Pacearchaeota archaeon]
MKNLLIGIITLLFLFTFEAEAQKSKTLAAKDPRGSWLWETNLAANDTTGAGDSTWTYTVKPNKGERLYYDMELDVDSVSGTGGVVAVAPFILQGRRLSTHAWTNIDTANYSGTADTIIRFTQITTAQFYTEFKVTLTQANSAFGLLVDKFKARFWY